MPGARSRHGQDVAAAALGHREGGAGAEEGVATEDGVEAADEVAGVVRRAPVEAAAAVDVDLLLGVPFHAGGDAEGALLREHGREHEAQAGPGGGGGGQAVVVVRLGEVDERAALLGEAQGVGEHGLEGAAVIGLEDLGIGPVQPRVADEGLGRLHRAAEALEQEDGVGELAPHQRHDDVPRRLGDHVAGVAAEAVHAQPAPVQEDVGDLAAEGGLGIVQLHQVFPRHAPGAGRVEGAVHVALVPLRVVDLEGRRPAGVVRRQIHEEAPAVRVRRRHQLAELIQRRGRGVELRQRRIHRKEVQPREGRAVAPHPRVGRRRRVDGQEQEVAEAQPREEVPQVARQRAEGPARRDHRVARPVERPLLLGEGPERRRRGHRRAELPGEGRVDHVAAGGVRRGHLDDRVAPLGPFRHGRVVRDEAGLAREDAHLQQRHAHPPLAAPARFHRDVVPIVAADQPRLVHVGQHLALMHRGRAQVRAEDHPPAPPPLAEGPHLQHVSDPAQQLASGRRFLSHAQRSIPSYHIPRTTGRIIPNRPGPRKSRGPFALGGIPPPGDGWRGPSAGSPPPRAPAPRLTARCAPLPPPRRGARRRAWETYPLPASVLLGKQAQEQAPHDQGAAPGGRQRDAPPPAPPIMGANRPPRHREQHRVQDEGDR